MKKFTYAMSGVDISLEEKAVEGILSAIRFRRKGIGEHIGGHYAGLINFGEHVLAFCIDGVGSKIMVANEMRKWDTIGIDCIAMNVNDCICVGAEPIAFVDYLAMERMDPRIAKEIGKGLSRGAEMANISIVGGETATLPDMIRGMDLAGACIGYAEKSKIVLGDKITEGDVIIGLGSSGLHSNGYTLVRKILKEKGFSYSHKLGNKSLGDILLTPTRIYVKEILELLGNIDVHGLAHITGGGIKNLMRLNKKVKFVISDPMEPQPIFYFIQKEGKVEWKEMFQTFNMGMGLAVIVPRDEKDDAISILEKNSEAKVKEVGYVDKGRGVDVKKFKLHYE